jgi:hypothetical protein
MRYIYDLEGWVKDAQNKGIKIVFWQEVFRYKPQ